MGDSAIACHARKRNLSEQRRNNDHPCAGIIIKHRDMYRMDYIYFHLYYIILKILFYYNLRITNKNV